MWSNKPDFMILVFDMDDTLYDELTYVRSGFTAVTRMLAPICDASPAKLLSEMTNLLSAKGRGQVFDDLLALYGQHSRALVARCVKTYRHHKPQITLWPEAADCLTRHQNLPIYVVSDGHKVAQNAKATALGLQKWAKRILLTHRFGIKNAKPSPYCFQRITAWESARPSQVVYIADNPAKDFVGLKKAGFKTIRVRSGQYASIKAKPGHDAERTVDSLAEINFTT